MARRSGSVSGIIIELGADNKGLAEAIDSSYRSARTLETELRKVSAALKIDPKNQAFKNQSIEVLKESITATEQKLKDLKEAQRVAAEAFQKGEMSPERYREIERQVGLTEARLKGLREELNRQESAWIKAGDKMQAAGQKMQNAGEKMQQFGGKATKAVTMPLAAIGTVAVKSAIDFESAMAGVRKTTDLTDDEFARMSDSIRKMAMEIPASTEEIAGVAEAAGQLGIQKDNILDFTRVIIDMGNSTNLSAEQGATQMARFANIVQMSQQDFSRLGSAIVALGNNYATTESEIMDMAMRLAGAGKQAKMSEGDILGIATALSSLGLEAQAGGSAFSKTIAMIQTEVETGGDRLEDFARIAGMSVQQFASLWERDAAQAVAAFVLGLGDVERHGKSATVLLDELGIKELRLSDALKRTSGAQDIFVDALKLGNRAWEENNALTNEANQRYETSASKLEVQKNKMKDAAIELGQNLLPHVTKFVEFLGDLIQKFSELSPAAQDMIIKLGAIAAAIGPLAKAGGMFTSGLGKVVEAAGKASKAIGAVGGLAGNITGLLGPLGIAIGAVIGLTKVAELLGAEFDNTSERVKKLAQDVEESDKKLREATEGIEAQGEEALALSRRLEELNKKSKRTAAEQAEMEAIVRKLNETMPGLNLTINEQTGALEGTTDAVQRYVREWMKSEILKEYGDEILANMKRQEEAAQNLADAEKRHKKAKDDILTAKLIAEQTYDKEQGKLAVERAKEAEKRAGEDVELAKKTQAEIIANSKEYQKKIDGIEKELDGIFGSMHSSHAEYARESAKIAVQAMQKEEEVLTKKIEFISEEDKARSKHYSELEEAARSHHQKIFNIESKGLAQSDLTLKQAIKNLQKQAEQFSQWRTNIQKLAKKVPPDVLGEIEKLGPGQAKLVADLVKATPAQVQALVDAWRTTGQLSKQGALDEMQGIVPGAKQYTDEAAEAVREGKDSMFRAGKDLGKSGVAGFDDGVGDPKTIGENLVDGIKTGMSNRADSLYNKSESITKTAINKMKNIALTKSPSRVTMEIGSNLGEGLIIGIDRMKTKAADSAGSLTASALDAMRVLSDPLSNMNWSGAAGEFAMPDTVLQTKRFEITGNQFVVREEADIQRIAHELHRLMQRQERSLVV